MRNDRHLIYLLAAAALYLGVMIHLGRLPNLDGDELFFKAPGREWAATGRFAAPELAGFHDLNPPPEEVWLLYPPLYPMLFGGFVKLFHFGWRQCIAFDALIHVGLALVTYRVALKLSTGGDSRAAFWAGLAILPLGASVAGRPDELAICLGMAGLLPLLSPRASPGRSMPLALAMAAASGALFGLCAGASSVAAVVLGLIALGFLITRAESPARLIALGLVWAGSAAVALAVLLAPVLVVHPDAYLQYVQNARLCLNDPRPRWQKLVGLLRFGWPVNLPTLGILALGLVHAAGAARGARWRSAQLWLGPASGVAFLLLLGPHNARYPWFLGPYALAAAAVSLVDPTLKSGARPRGARCFAIMLTLLTLLGSLDTVRQTLILALLPRDQSLEYNARLLCQVLPRGTTVMTYDHWWSLAGDHVVFDQGLGRAHWKDVEYILVGAGDLAPSVLDLGPALHAYMKEHFRPIQDNRSKRPVTLFGLPLSRSYLRGFGTLIFARCPEPALRHLAQTGGGPIAGIASHD
jgi:hypothetical protein